MSCGQQPAFDDVCAGDRLGRLLNRARPDGPERESFTPSNAHAQLHTPPQAGPSPTTQGSPACMGHGCDRCATCLSGTCCVGRPESMESMDRVVVQPLGVPR